MQHRITLRSLATWKNFAALSVLYVLLGVGFAWRDLCMGGKFSLDGRIFDLYTPTETKGLLDQMGEHGRTIYAFTQLSLDLLFPLVYAGLMIIILRKIFGSLKYLLLLPLLTVAADLLENATTAYIAYTYDGTDPQLARVASVFTFAKWTGVLLVAIVLIGGLCSKAWTTMLRRDNKYKAVD